MSKSVYKPKPSVTQKRRPAMLSDDQLAQRLRNLATDAELSGNYITAKWLGEAAARLMELASAWHPSMGVSDGVTIGNWESEHHKAFMRVVDDILDGSE
jgi:hypothetical protein